MALKQKAGIDFTEALSDLISSACAVKQFKRLLKNYDYGGNGAASLQRGSCLMENQVKRELENVLADWDTISLLEKRVRLTAAISPLGSWMTSEVAALDAYSEKVQLSLLKDMFVKNTERIENLQATVDQNVEKIESIKGFVMENDSLLCELRAEMNSKKATMLAAEVAFRLQRFCPIEELVDTFSFRNCGERNVFLRTFLSLTNNRIGALHIGKMRQKLTMTWEELSMFIDQHYALPDLDKRNVLFFLELAKRFSNLSAPFSN
ncbi:hypothetical protein ROZALSC1DRAFT_22077 [Rozella allomycis CSF55]|uniref:Uncharacterized protein n=1 Tax=Rozella allomycis (strain CSF55) TaxID=988480 RepID=A0A4P9YJC5_ROZAC|nr:hypothetical protein ROZALSC1DRAFT_22077 [Rozella allomycis CSF55]